MNVSLYQAASALNASNRWQEVIAENLASSSTPGFKKQDLSVSGIAGGALPTSSGQPAGSSTQFVLPKASFTTSFAPGEMKYTGVNTDVAVQGPGFFEVQLPNGSIGYTRDGEFQLDSQGRLVTKEGYLVMSSGGSIQMDQRLGAPLAISADGEVSQGPDQKGKLNLVEFNDPKLLTQISGGYFIAANPNLQTQAATQSTVRQGYLEGSNSNPVTEMANMMVALRNFEANQRTIQIQDDRMSKSIHDLTQS